MTVPVPSYPTELQRRIREYYEEGYRLKGRTDIERSVEWRLREEHAELERIEEVQKFFNIQLGNGQRHLVVGGGTGGLAVALHLLGCEVYTIEPVEEAIAIARLKSAEVNLAPEVHQRGVAEHIPFRGSTFDFVHCFTVLEHVSDVEASLDEMIRVTKPSGMIRIICPDYRFPYEDHYKIPFPTFLPRVFGSIYLRALGKPAGFWRTINRVTAPKIDRILCRKNVLWFRLRRPLPKSWNPPIRKHLRLFAFFTHVLGIPKSQEIFIRKLQQ